MVGFEHVWIYISEPWEDEKNLPSLDFVTFIPYNNRVQDFMYRANGTIGVFNLSPWRAKRLELDWIVFLTLSN